MEKGLLRPDLLSPTTGVRGHRRADGLKLHQHAWRGENGPKAPNGTLPRNVLTP